MTGIRYLSDWTYAGKPFQNPVTVPDSPAAALNFLHVVDELHGRESQGQVLVVLRITTHEQMLMARAGPCAANE
jgi:hypothetical protein